MNFVILPINSLYRYISSLLLCFSLTSTDIVDLIDCHVQFFGSLNPYWLHLSYQLFCNTQSLLYFSLALRLITLLLFNNHLLFTSINNNTKLDLQSAYLYLVFPTKMEFNLHTPRVFFMDPLCIKSNRISSLRLTTYNKSNDIAIFDSPNIRLLFLARHWRCFCQSQ